MLYPGQMLPNATASTITVPPRITGCCSREFDESYSMHLQPYMDQQTWSQIIRDINVQLQEITKYARLFAFLPILVVLIFPVFILVGIFTDAFFMIFIGIALIFVLMISCVVAINVMNQRGRARLEQFVSQKNNEFFVPRGINLRLRSMSVRAGRQNSTAFWLEIELAAPTVVVVQVPQNYGVPTTPPPYGSPVPNYPPQAYPQQQPTYAQQPVQTGYPVQTAYPVQPSYPVQQPPPQQQGGNVFCGKCGTAQTPGNDFCGKCGSPFQS